jgi:predicted RNase H-like HicB family nuclease
MELDYTYWQDDDWFIGYLNDYPKDWTQGRTIVELEEMLFDLYEMFQEDEKSLSAASMKMSGQLKIPA